VSYGTRERRYRSLVRQVLHYWEDNASRYAGFDVSFRLNYYDERAEPLRNATYDERRSEWWTG